MGNRFGKESTLRIFAKVRDDGRTVTEDLDFTAPFKVMRPFHSKDGTMSVMALMASAGIMAGDRQRIEIKVGEGARMEFISQAYEKIHRMEGDCAKRITDIEVGREAFLFYNPLPVIPFGGSDFRSSLTVRLEDETSRFILSEVLSCGRVFHGERFGFRRFKNLVKIYQGSELAYRDNTLYEPEWMDMEGVGLYEGFTHLANLVICNIPKSAEWIDKVRELLDEREDMEGGVTLTGAGYIVIRILGFGGQRLTETMNEILELDA